MKIVRQDGSIIEGTAAEIAEFEALTRFKASPSVGAGHTNSIESTQEIAEDWEFVSADLAFRTLTRLKLSKQFRDAIRMIYVGGEKWSRASEIQREIGYSASQFAGMMGAFGRRLINTPGYVLHSAFFETEWSNEDSCYLYRLPPSVRAAVEKARIVDVP